MRRLKVWPISLWNNLSKAVWKNGFMDMRAQEWWRCVCMFVSVFVKGIQYMQVQFPRWKLSIMHKNDHRQGNMTSQPSGTSYGINPFVKAHCKPEVVCHLIILLHVKLVLKGLSWRRSDQINNSSTHGPTVLHGYNTAHRVCVETYDGWTTVVK